jgi:hypothetical protein
MAKKKRNVPEEAMEELEETVRRMENREVTRRQKEREQEAMTKWKKEEKEKQKQGKKVFHLKDSASFSPFPPFFSPSPLVSSPCPIADFPLPHRREEGALHESQVRGTLAGQAEAAQSDGQEAEEDRAEGEEAHAQCEAGSRALSGRRAAVVVLSSVSCIPLLFFVERKKRKTTLAFVSPSSSLRAASTVLPASTFVSGRPFFLASRDC